jgi:Exocyst complex component Sec10
MRSAVGSAEEDASPELDDEVAALVRKGPFESMILETPPAQFDAAELVEALTSPYIADAGAGVVALDPQALKKLFSTVQVMLSGMAVEAEQQTVELELDAGPVEDEYRQGLAQHASTLELLSSNLAKVDTRFRKVTAEAVRTGDSLGKKEAQRLRAANAIELLEYFKVFDELPAGFADGQNSVLQHMKALPIVFSDEDRRAEAAQVLSRLRAVTFELEAPGLDRAAGNMRAYR